MQSSFSGLDPFAGRISRGEAGVMSMAEGFGPLWPGGAPPPAGFHAFPGRPIGRVLIAGLGSEELPRELREISEEVGWMLAACGFGLVAGGWPGVDEAVTSAFLDRLSVWGASPEDWLLQVVEPRRKPRPRAGALMQCKTIEESIERSIDQADAVILISGEGGTARIGRAAMSRDVPVLPIAKTGGDAEKIFTLLRHQQPSYPAPGVFIAEFDRLSELPILAVALVPRMLRQILAHSGKKAAAQPSEAVAGQGAKLGPAEWRNVVAIQDSQGRPVMTGFVLAKPRVIVSDGVVVNTGALNSSHVTVRDFDGQAHTVSTGWKRVGKHPFGPIIMDVPTTLDAPGFLGESAPPQAPIDVRIPTWHPDGFKIVTGKIEQLREETVTMNPVGKVQHLVRVNASVEPGSSGAPVLDKAGAVIGFVVGNSGRVTYQYPARHWHSGIVAAVDPKQSGPAQKAASPASRKKARPNLSSKMAPPPRKSPPSKKPSVGKARTFAKKKK